MATQFSSWPIFIFTFLYCISLLTSAQEISLVKEPDENYYIVKKIPVVIVCQAKNAAEIAFTCFGTQIPSTSVEVKDVSDKDPDLIEAEIEVTRADVLNSEGQGSFWCSCSAVDNEGNVAVTSRAANVSIASLKNIFVAEPKSATVEVGQDVEFACEAPEGHPRSEIMWRKDKKRLEVENNPRIYVTKKNSLIIQSVTLEDKGQYQCIARNVAGRRESQEAQLTVTALAESEEPVLELLEKESPSKKSPGAGKLRATRQSNIKPYFTTEPKDNYYITKDKPLIIDCGVVAADILTFNCNGKRMERERQKLNQGLDLLGNRVIQAQLTITYDEGEQFLKEAMQEQSFHCVCVAWFQDSSDPNGWGRINSDPSNGFVHLAYLDTAFQIEPIDVTASLNSDATFVCSPPKGQPSPWVYWYKDRSRLDPRTNEKYSLNVKGSLIIHNVQHADAGLYSCFAENSVSSAQTRPARLIVTDEVATTTEASTDSFPTFPADIPSRPLFLQDFEGEYTLTPDGTRKMVCAVVSAEQITIDCGGQRLGATEYDLRTEVHRETAKRLLRITAVITSEKLQNNPDDFFCQCTAWYLNEQRSWETISSSQGYIREAPSQAYIEDEFRLSPVDTDAIVESGAELYCQPPEGNPTPEVYWLKDGVRIGSEEDSNYVVGETGSLFIELVLAEDEGEYTCVAENDAGVRQSQPVQFTVLGVDKPETQDETTRTTEAEYNTTTPLDYDMSTFDVPEPYFVVDLDEEYYIVNNAPVTLACTVVASKTLLFVCNGEILKDTAITGTHYQDPQSLETLRENSLIITRDQIEEYEGSEPYSCFCRTYYQKKGGAPTELLTVESSTGVIHISYIQDNFHIVPSDTVVDYLGRVVLQCSPPDGIPELTVSWLKDNHPIVESQRVGIQQNGNLIIDSFNEDDQGSYNCVANNSFSEVISPAARVTLKRAMPDKETTEPEPETTPSVSEKLFVGNPYISKDLHSVYYVVKNKPVTITCEAFAVDYITFTCGKQTVEDQETKERMDEMQLPDGKLTVVKVVEASITVSKSDVDENEKDYWCRCFAHYRIPSSDEDQILESIKGYVELAYIKKNFQKEPENQTVVEGDALNIQCQPPSGNPEPKVTWTKNGEEIEALSITPTGVLIIPEVKLDHAGKYICIAENEAGKRMSSPVEVIVKAIDGTSPFKPDTEENVDGETVEGSQTIVDGETVEGSQTIVDGETVEGSQTIVDGETVEGSQTIVDGETEEGSQTIVDGETVEGSQTIVDGETVEGSQTVVDGETVEGSQTFIGESEVDFDTNKVTEEVTELIVNREIDESTDKGRSGENVDKDENEENIELTKLQVSEGGLGQLGGKVIEDDIEENIPKTVDENKKENLGGRNIEWQNKNEKYEERDRTNVDYDVHEGRYDSKDNNKDKGYEGRGETKANNEDKDYSYKERDESMDTKVDGYKSGIGSRKSIEGNECAQMLTSCSNILPRNVNHIVYCAAVPEYTACVDNYFKKCSGLVNEISMNAVKMAYMDTQQKCTLQQKCPKLNECKVISSNSLDNTMDRSGISVTDLCKDTSAFLQCVDHKLEDCNVTMFPPEENSKASLLDIEDWFTQYCNKFILNDKLESCNKIEHCELHIEQLAADNATYWCSILKSLGSCTDNAAKDCDLEDVANDLVHFHTEATDKYCTDDIFGKTWPEITPEPEGETGPTGVEPEPVGTDSEKPTDNGDGDNGEEGNKKGGAAASKEDPDNGSAVLGTSILLATILQLLAVVCLSWR